MGRAGRAARGVQWGISSAKRCHGALLGSWLGDGLEKQLEKLLSSEGGQSNGLAPQVQPWSSETLLKVFVYREGHVGKAVHLKWE